MNTIQVIPTKYESELAEYLKKCTLINHGLSSSKTRVIAYSFETANRLSTPPGWAKHDKASEDWLSFFLKWDPSLSIRKLEQTSQARAAGFNKPVVDNFYNKLDYSNNKHKFKAHQVRNGDENNPTVMPPHYGVASKGIKQVI